MTEKKEIFEKDHLLVLKSLNEIPFAIGKKLLADFLVGRMSNKSITKNNLFNLYNFGSLSRKTTEELESIIDNLIVNGLIEQSTPLNSFYKLLSISKKCMNELANPTLEDKKIKNRISLNISRVTEDEKKLFSDLESVIGEYNDDQKKAIISRDKRIVCIAGAGSGKTSVLVKRIEFLVRYRAVSKEKILAITFTRKAKQEMETRLSRIGIQTNVETFNSFSEKILRENMGKVYGRRTRIMNYSDKIFALEIALSKFGLTIEGAIDKYFSEIQKRGKEIDKLAHTFMNDCYSIIEYFKAKREDIYDFSKNIEKDKENAKIIYQTCLEIINHMKIQGLRDFTDQLIDVLDFLKENKSFTPNYEYILVDEYQDVNDAQIELLDILNPENLFVVGDPRQSIFGWRGSNIEYILKFQEKYPNSIAIGLNRNYRSGKKIVNLMNESISSLGLENLETDSVEEGEVRLVDFDSEDEEYEFIVKQIKESNLDRNEIFILARTNRQLNELSKKLSILKIPHVVKSDEHVRSVEARAGEIILSTIHAIKGLEAELVFLMGATEQNFPCKVSDHPVLEFVKGQDSDKEEEERRLFYVAISRARKKLVLTYSGKKHTHFITDEIRRSINKGLFEDIYN